MIRSLALALAATLLAPVAPPVAAEAATASAAYCRTDARVTTIRWTSGRITRHRDMTLRTSPLPGLVTRVRARTRRAAPVVVACRVLTGRVDITLKNGSRWQYTARTQVDTPTPVVQPVHNHVPPAKMGQWREQVTLYVDSSVGADWQVAEMAAAWGAGVAVTTEPCTAEMYNGCVPVFVGEADEYVVGAWGLAWPYADDHGAMASCRILLDQGVPTLHRPEVAAHEIGHCLGLPHWTTEGSDPITVMSERVRASRPTARDLEWLHS